MKTASFFARAMLVCCAVLFGAASVRAETITLFGSDNLPPKSWLDKDTPRGYSVDAAREVLALAGFQVDVRLTAWARAVEEVKAGKGILTHVSKTPEREQFFEFSDPLVYDRIVVVVKKGKEFPFQHPRDLMNRRVGVLRGATYGGPWSSVVDRMQVEYDTDAVARLGKLMRDRLDCAIISSGRAGLKIAAQQGGYDLSDFTILPTPVIEDPNYLAIAKGPDSAKTMARINAAIRTLRANGGIERIMREYEAQQ
jgi:polar amino acid transport system substrate-binding protein